MKKPDEISSGFFKNRKLKYLFIFYNRNFYNSKYSQVN